MWFFALIPVAVTSIVLQFMPDIIPMHHDLAGNTDRWGSKMESFIFPVIIMFITLFWYLLIRVWSNTITWLLYGVYFLVTVVLLIAPKMKK